VKLSVNILFSELKAHFPKTVLHKEHPWDDELSISRPYYYDGEIDFRSGQVYVSPRPPLDFNMQKNVSIITTGDDTDPTQVFNSVLSIFDKYQDWDNTLRNLILDASSVEDYLTCSLPLITHAMTVHDNNYRFLARVGKAMMPKKEVENQSFVEPEFLLKIDEQIEESIFCAKNIIHYRDLLSGSDFLFLNLFNGNTVSGRLAVSSHARPLDAKDASLAKHLGKYLEAALKQAAFSGEVRNPRKDALLTILSGKQHNENRIQHLRTISPYGRLAQDQSLYCLCCVCQDPNITERYAAYKLELALPDAVAVLFDSAIVVLCANRAKQTTAAYFEVVQQLMAKYSLKIGCSDPFTEFHYLYLYYQQAASALQLGGQTFDKYALYHFKDFALEHFFQYGCSVLPSRLICADCIGKLAERDNGAAVSYCESLRVYLDTGQNAMETARRLGIKRNTFLARLERISRYLDLDLGNANDRLYIEISLHLIQRA
jgi:hypothetical protein